jgi:hypothetical protein
MLRLIYKNHAQPRDVSAVHAMTTTTSLRFVMASILCCLYDIVVLGSKCPKSADSANPTHSCVSSTTLLRRTAASNDTQYCAVVESY